VPPSFAVVYVADNGLAAGVDMNVFDPHCLLATTSKFRQSLCLCGECSQKLHCHTTARI
jgi:hypothetical protein